MQMLGNFGAKRKLFYIFDPNLSKNRFYTTEEADIYRRCKQIQHFSKKKLNIARNIMCFIMVLVPLAIIYPQ